MTIALPEALAEAIRQAAMQSQSDPAESVVAKLQRIFGKPLPLKPGQTIREKVLELLSKVEPSKSIPELAKTEQESVMS